MGSNEFWDKIKPFYLSAYKKEKENIREEEQEVQEGLVRQFRSAFGDDIPIDSVDTVVLFPFYNHVMEYMTRIEASSEGSWLQHCVRRKGEGEWREVRGHGDKLGIEKNLVSLFGACQKSVRESEDERVAVRDMIADMQAKAEDG